MIPLDWIAQANERIRHHIVETPLTFDPSLNVYLKWENNQITGSFKVRGALNKLLSLQDWELRHGIVTASAGNHGQGVALAANQLGIKPIVFASEDAVQRKLDAMRELGAEVRLVEGGYGEAERAGLNYARRIGANWISPYNDEQVIAGQGTLAFEILRQEPALALAEWVVPVGGGGLISGIGTVLASKSLPARLTGVQSRASPYMHDIYYTGTQELVLEQPSLGDGLAGPVEPGSITIPIVRKVVDGICLVSEDETAFAIAHAWRKYNQMIEGSAAVCFAAVLTGKIQARPAVLILSGGNIQPDLHAEIVGKYSNYAVS